MKNAGQTGACWKTLWEPLELEVCGASGAGLQDAGQPGCQDARIPAATACESRRKSPSAVVKRPSGAAENNGTTVTQQNCYQLRCHGNKATAGPRSTRSGRSRSSGREVTIFKTLHHKIHSIFFSFFTEKSG